MMYRMSSFPENSWEKYWFEKNLWGDIIAVYDDYGELLIEYSYDAWGNCAEDRQRDSYGAFYNPFRYRGYYYDAETGFYYVSSRYYDPEIGRWINADSQISSVGGDIRGYNLFSYCFNNPVNCKQRPVIKKLLNNSVHLNISLDILSKTTTAKIDGYAIGLKNTNILKKLNDPVVNPLYDGQLIQFDYSKNPDYNIFTSFYYANKLYEMGLPTGRTYEGIWFELLGHYIIHKLDILDLTDRDDVADMGSYEYDNNAYIWENIIHGIMKGLENWYYDYC